MQGLCLLHHQAKSALDGTSTFAAANHPDWLTRSAIPLTIVAGPPCAGKTTYVEQRSRNGDVLIDLDRIMMSLRPGYLHWSGSLDSALLNKAVRVRNAMLGALARETAGSAWFIVSAPTDAERTWWHGKLGGDVVLLHPGAQECKRRAVERCTPLAVAGIDRWEVAARKAWSPERAGRVTTSVNSEGWPV